jgi:LysM repeat protein
MRSLFPVVLVLCIIATACGQASTPAATATPAPTATPPPTAVPTLTPTRTPAPTPTPTLVPTPLVVYHVVQAGEVLGQIAKLYGVTVEAIAKANGITDVDFIREGDKLLIPSGEAEVVP